MTVLLLLLIFAALWALAIGKNMATIKNYDMGYRWYLPAWVGGPFTTIAFAVMVLSSDEMKTRRKLTQMKIEQRLLEAKLDEDKTLTKYLEYHE